MAEVAKCEICGEPMPMGEEMFKFHGYSGPCPKPPMPRRIDPVNLLSEKEQLEWLWANCKIVYFPPHPEYPIEHSPTAKKDSRTTIEAEMVKGR